MMWFDEVLGRSFGARPSLDECQRIAEETRNIICFVGGSDDPVEKRPGTSLALIREEKLNDILEGANGLLAALDELAPYLPNGQWTRERDGFPFAELREILHSIPVSGHKRQLFSGRPKAKWLPFGRRFAQLVAGALGDLQFRGSSAAAKKKAVADIGGLMLSYVVPGIKPENAAKTFADGIRGDRPSRAKRDHFPHRNRLVSGTDDWIVVETRSLPNNLD
jgi:hypothetical protein